MLSRVGAHFPRALSAGYARRGMNLYAVIVAGGSGVRFGGSVRKQYLELGGAPILLRSVARIRESARPVRTVITAPAADVEKVREMLPVSWKETVSVVAGGSERQHSVWNGIQALTAAAPDDLILIHDAVRPLVSVDAVSAVVAKAKESGAATVGLKMRETVKKIGPASEDIIMETIDRSPLWTVQTPQVFRAEWIRRAHERAATREQPGTDDCQLIEWMGRTVRLVPGNVENIKITTPEDLAMAEALVKGGLAKLAELPS